jgi:DNA invertase Pin-like site-specific DNA recombinase
MTRAEMIHDFIAWAEVRLKKELDFCEKLESEFGQIPLNEKPIKLTNLTDEDRLDIIQEIEHLISHGYTARKASKECGIHDTTYYRWKRELNDEKCRENTNTH